MKILITGASGLIGSAVAAALREEGHEVIPLIRGTAPLNFPSWDPECGYVNLPDDAVYDAVIHLAGENIATSRWTKDKKSRIRQSRVRGTEALVDAVAKLKERPGAFICASAIGYYGDRGDDVMTESSEPGTGFLSAVCQDWEKACRPLRDLGVRTVNLRTGVVMTPNGGALRKMLPAFRAGVGGPVGNGKQYVSWISLADQVGAISFILKEERISGPVNLVAPYPVTNGEMAKLLGTAVRRPAFLPLPRFVANVLFGEMGRELLLSSTRVLPEVLQAHAYRFQHPTLDQALHEMIGS